MDFRITTLVDNSVSLSGGKLIGEHGLSFYVETGENKIHAIIGGLHLGKASDAKLEKIIDHLSEFNPQKIGVSHCTGTKAILALFDRFTDRVFVNSVGTGNTF